MSILDLSKLTDEEIDLTLKELASEKTRRQVEKTGARQIEEMTKEFLLNGGQEALITTAIANAKVRATKLGPTSPAKGQP